VRPPISFVLLKLSNSLGEANVTVGTTPDGGAPAGTSVAFERGAAGAGVVRPDGTGGDGQALAVRVFVRRGHLGRECSVRVHYRNHYLVGADDLFPRCRRLAEKGEYPDGQRLIRSTSVRRSRVPSLDWCLVYLRSRPAALR
jgi:hypothetical protein